MCELISGLSSTISKAAQFAQYRAICTSPVLKSSRTPDRLLAPSLTNSIGGSCIFTDLESFKVHLTNAFRPSELPRAAILLNHSGCISVSAAANVRIGSKTDVRLFGVSCIVDYRKRARTNWPHFAVPMSSPRNSFRCPQPPETEGVFAFQSTLSTES